jgi:outer membrane protein assembly factor BamB
LALALAVGLTVTPARAVIERPYPLEKAIKDGQFIFTAKVEKLDPEKPSAVLTVGDSLQGKAPFARLPINLTGDEDSQKKKETPQLLKRLAPKLPLVVFVSKQDKRYVALAYTNGTWFQMTADEGGENPVWSFTHCEPYLRRTFKGTTAEMQQAVADAVAGKKEPPRYDPKEKPGLGPEVEEKPKEKDGAPGASGGPPFAVIPSVAIGGVLSVLAMLFPAVFGGLTGQLRRWIAMISVASLNATLLWLHDAFSSRLEGTWWGSPAALWLTMTGLTAVGVLWAWRRHLRELSSKSAPANELPSRYEQVLLLILSGSGVILFGVCWLLKYPLLRLPWSFVLALWVGIWAGTLYVLWVRWRAARPRTQPALSSEGVVLWAMVPACLVLGYGAAAGVTTGGAGGGAVQGPDGTRGARFLEAAALFSPQGAGGAGGAVYARPLIDGERLYAAAALSGALNSTFGAVYCVERSTGKLLWTFNNDGRMKQILSSPCLADGKLYIGEGFHSDSGCRLYCLGAADGKKLWEHKTESHTESSPCVAGNKVYCGAGSDGLLCLDAATGDTVWEYKRGHIDCPPVVAGKYVYGGSAVDRDIDGPQETAIFCLDAETGNEVWRVTTNLPAWGKPFVSGEQAFFPLGNGDVMKSAEPPEKPAGAVVCVSAQDGKQAWRFDVPDGVIEGPAVDRGQVYFGCRDGHCYCVGRQDGQLRWKHDMGSPVVATPALAACSCCGVTNSVYAVARDGKVCCLDPAGGRPMWQYEQFSAAELISPPIVTVEAGPQGDRRAVYFGAGVNGSTQAVLYCLKDQWQD